MHQDLDLLQGSWSVTGLNVEGQKMSADMLVNAQITIKGNRFTSTGMGAVYKGTLELDSSKSPRQLTMKFDAGPEKGNTNLGIYKLASDTWTICLATRGAVRPSHFAAPAGSGFALETLARGVAPAAAKTKVRASKKAVPATSGSTPASATEFEGEWLLISGIMDGRAMEKSLVKWVKRVTEGNQTTVYAGPQVMLKVEFSSDASQSPKAIDYLNTAGSNKGKTQAGIYEFEGDLLKFCLSAPGAARPTQFQSAPGDGRTLTVWKRA
jgi:uncharacterized protein (TIGR03067 family)